MTATATKPLSDLLTRTRQRADQRDAANAEAYAKLVRAAAAGKVEMDPEKLLAQLDKLDRDPAAFQVDVEALAERFELKARVDRLPELERERAAIEEAVGQHNAERDAAILEAEAAHAAAVQPLLNRNTALVAAIDQAQAAAAKLKATCPADRRDALTAALRAASAKAAQVTKLESQLVALRSEHLPRAVRGLAESRNAAANPQIWAKTIGGANHDSAAQERDRLQRDVKFAEDRLANLKAEIESAERERIPAAKRELEELQAEAQAADAALLTP